MEQRGGLWFGWSGGRGRRHRPESAVRTELARAGQVRSSRHIDLSPGDEHDRYYNEFSNSTLWPLLHSMPELMAFDRRNARQYPRGEPALRRCRSSPMLTAGRHGLGARLPPDVPAGDAAGAAVLASPDRVLSAHSVPFTGHAGERSGRRVRWCSDLTGRRTCWGSRRQNDMPTTSPRPPCAWPRAERLPGRAFWEPSRGTEVRLAAFPIEIEAAGALRETAEQSWLVGPGRAAAAEPFGPAADPGGGPDGPHQGARAAPGQLSAPARDPAETVRSPGDVPADCRRESRTDVAAYRDLRNQQIEQEAGAINSSRTASRTGRRCG